MREIHPTAVIDASAEIGEDCVIGPFCVIGPGVRLGARSRLLNHVTLAGPSDIGEDNVFYPGCSIGQRTQDLKYAGEPTHLRIGNGNTFRECCTVNRGTAPGSCTIVGNNGNFLAYSHIAHDCVVGDGVIFSNNGTLAGHVTVENHAIIGGLTAVHQFCRIGKYSILGGCTKIVQDVPPFMIADGNPAEVRGVNQVGLERHGFPSETVRLLKEAYRLLYRSNFNTRQALDAIRSQLEQNAEIAHLVAFVENSKRGIVR